jgi:hypothetical protein
MHSVCVVVVVVVELHVTVNYIKTLSVAQQFFNDECMSPATMQIMRTSVERKYITTNLYSFHALHIKAALKQKSFSVCVNVAVKHFISDGINQL